MDLSPFIDLIHKESGLQIPTSLFTSLSDAIQERTTQRNLENSHRYFNFLIKNSQEIHYLIDLITNNETYFFRERPHFQICVDHLIPQILHQKKTKKIKIISAGCASGEEPYTLAIAIAEKFGWDIFDKISIIGFDISDSAIRAARTAEYGPHSFRESGKISAYREKYFKKNKNNQYELDASIKDCVKFFGFNLSQSPYPDWLNNVDIIFFRNVSIYFSQSTKESVFKKLYESLNDNGYLVIGSTETFSHNLEGFILDEIENRFFYTKNKKSEKFPNKIVAPLKPNQIKTATTNKKKITVPTPPKVSNKKEEDFENPQILFKKGLDYAIQKNYEKSFSCLKDLLKFEPNHIEAQNLFATIYINLKELGKAKEQCINVVKIEEWNLEARLLLGIIARMEENPKEAIKWFKSVSFIQPSCWTAHMYLAELLDMDGDFKGAHREYSLALKHLEKWGVEKRNLSYFPLAYNQEQLVHLFRHNLKNLEQRIN